MDFDCICVYAHHQIKIIKWIRFELEREWPLVILFLLSSFCIRFRLNEYKFIYFFSFFLPQNGQLMSLVDKLAYPMFNTQQQLMNNLVANKRKCSVKIICYIQMNIKNGSYAKADDGDCCCIQHLSKE